jgi:hypothetical protein
MYSVVCGRSSVLNYGVKLIGMSAAFADTESQGV